MTSPSFESLRVWHDARRLTSQIYLVTRDGPFERDFGLRDQIRRACVSVMSNIAEGYERGGRRETMRYFRMAKGSAAEVRAQLYAAEDIGYLDQAVARDIRRHAIEISRQLAAIIDPR